MRLTNLFAAATIAATALTSTAFAGGLAVTVVEPTIEVVPVAPTRSSWGIILPLVGLALLIGLASSSSDDES
jgi:hypothetical protein